MTILKGNILVLALCFLINCGGVATDIVQNFSGFTPDGEKVTATFRLPSALKLLHKTNFLMSDTSDDYIESTDAKLFYISGSGWKCGCGENSRHSHIKADLVCDSKVVGWVKLPIENRRIKQVEFKLSDGKSGILQEI